MCFCSDETRVPVAQTPTRTSTSPVKQQIEYCTTGEPQERKLNAPRARTPVHTRLYGFHQVDFSNQPSESPTS